MSRYVIEMKEEETGWAVRPVAYPTDITTLQYKQDVVGGLVDVVSIEVPGAGLDIDIWINDEGLLLGFPQNPGASLLAGQMLVGDAVVCGHDGNGESVSLTEDQVNSVLDYLKEKGNEWARSS